MRRASPRSRGWTPPHLGRPAARDGFPALAGMDPAGQGRGRRRRRLPRARGDGPEAAATGSGARAASPRSRGWTLRVTRLEADAQGFPALAGMDPPGRTSRPRPDRLPRARGDGPVETSLADELRGASPRSRGWTLCARGIGRHPLGFPALAGMDPGGDAGRGGAGRLPRARGDGPVLAGRATAAAEA